MLLDDNSKIKINNELKDLKEKMNKVSQEIDSVEKSFYKHTNEIGKIQKMLNIENLLEYPKMFHNMNQQLSKVDRRREESKESTLPYSDDLEKDKERLENLWNAYKNLEEERTLINKTSKEIEDLYQKEKRRLKNLLEQYEKLESENHILKEKLNQWRSLSLDVFPCVIFSHSSEFSKEEEKRWLFELLTANSAKSLNRLLLDICNKKYLNFSEIEKAIDFKLKGFDIDGF